MNWFIASYLIVFVGLTAWTLWSGHTGRWVGENDDWTWMWVFWIAWPFLVLVIPMEVYDWAKEKGGR